MAKKPLQESIEMMALFAGHTGAYGTHGIPTQRGLKWEIKTTANTIRSPVTVELWEDHLSGKKPLGIITIREDNTCYWGSIDVDDYQNDLLTLIDRCERLNLPLVASRSKSGGLHLFLFLSEPTPALLLQTALKNLAAQLGVAGSEIFPKQVQVLTERGDVGNWMVMPYYGDTFGGKLREQVGLRKTGAELTLTEFISAAKAARILPEVLNQWQTVDAPRQTHRNGNVVTLISRSNEPFADGPVCLQILAKEKISLGEGQNNTLLNMGVYFKKKDPLAWEDQLQIANREYLSPPGTPEGLQSVSRSLGKKAYEYTCKIDPLRSHCNASLCRTRKFGVGGETDYPDISGLSKLNTDPPIWFVDVGDRRLEVMTDDLWFYARFQKVCFERVNSVFSMMKQDVWTAVLRPLMENCTIIESPPEVSRAGQFFELLDEFCNNRQKGKSREDLLVGRPWENEEEGRIYFQLGSLQKFLVKENIKDYTRGQITTKIKDIGGDAKFLNIKGKGRNTWWVPSRIFDSREPIPAPPLEGMVI